MTYVEMLNALRSDPAVAVEDPVRSSILIREASDGQLVWALPEDITEDQITDDMKAEIDYLYSKWEV